VPADAVRARVVVAMNLSATGAQFRNLEQMVEIRQP
jgi:hypothetical protein